MFFQKQIDMRSKEAMAKFLSSHQRYSTMSSVNRQESYANTVKLHSLGICGTQLDKAYDLISMDGLLDQISFPIQEFTEEMNGAYTVGFNGRSAGYMVLYSGEYYDPGYKSYCQKCYQKNFQSIPPGQQASCGVCKSPRQNYERPLKWHRTHNTGIDQDFSMEDFMDLSLSQLKDKVHLVRRFDEVCDDVRSEFIAAIDDFMIVEETVMVPTKVRRLERIEF